MQGLCPHSVSDHVHRLEGHRTMIGGDETGRSPSLTHPCRELLIVGHGRRETYQLEILRRVDDHLFPDGAPGPVLEIVHLVQDHETDLVESGPLGIDHVAEHLGRHDDDLGIPVDHVVPGQQPNPSRSVSGDEIRELLVGQCLYGRRVERALPSRARDGSPPRPPASSQPRWVPSPRPNGPRQLPLRLPLESRPPGTGAVPRIRPGGSFLPP